MNSNRIREIIREEVEDFLNDLNSSSTWTPWDASTKMDRMKPTNAMKAPIIPNGDYGVIRGYRDWNENYEDVMDYPTYCERFHVRR